MHHQIIEKLLYNTVEESESYPLPVPLKVANHIISAYFQNNISNKLCLVFPAKEYSAQWLSSPITFASIERDYNHFKDEIFESYKQYKKGEKLILNNIAIVEWSGIKETGVVFKTKGTKESSGAEIKINFSDVTMLRKAPEGRKALSSLKSVKQALPSRTVTATEKLLNINTFGNDEFIKNKTCLVCRFKNYEDSISNLLINTNEISDYFAYKKIDEDGKIDGNGTLILCNDFQDLVFYLSQSTVPTAMIIDGFSLINERRGDFTDIDTKFKIPTILITDISEIEMFDEIKNFGFDFFNFNKKNLNPTHSFNKSPFQIFERKLEKSISFKPNQEICHNSELQRISILLHSLKNDETDNAYTRLKISLIQIANLFSRICYSPTDPEIATYIGKIENIETYFSSHKYWLGDSIEPIREAIALLRTFITSLQIQKTEKFFRLNKLLDDKYNFIICPTEDEANTLRNHVSNSIGVITVKDLDDEILARKNKVNAVLTGWPKANILNKILSSFIFSTLSILLYQFENRYYTSFQNRYKKKSDQVKPTLNKRGERYHGSESQSNGFDDLFSYDLKDETTSEGAFDIVDFETRLDNVQYSKYSGKNSLVESCKAKRIDFENNKFIYATESHKFIIINELIEKVKQNPNLHAKKIEDLRLGDVIAFINTDRDVLVDLVEKTAKVKEYEIVKNWTDLWKLLLRHYYISIGSDFKKLITDLRNVNCERHVATIRTWLQDENRIGPDDDNDLISIALLTGSELLNENIGTVRKAISQMTSWRMRASDLVRDKIKSKLLKIADNSIINTSIEIQDLGTVEFLKISDIKTDAEEIDKRYIHRLIQKENI